jgi:hypothetical protein
VTIASIHCTDNFNVPKTVEDFERLHRLAAHYWRAFGVRNRSGSWTMLGERPAPGK